MESYPLSEEMGFVPALYHSVRMRDALTLATVHALVQAAGGAEEL